MIVSNLRNGRVRFSDRPEDLDDRGVAHARSAIGFWNADGPVGNSSGKGYFLSGFTGFVALNSR